MTQLYNLAQGPSAQRANFVTILAWLMIAGSACFCLISLMQNVMIHTVIPIDELLPVMEQQQLPALYRFFFTHIKELVFAMLLFSIFTLIASIALLKRKNWARLVFIVLFALAILGNIAGVFLQQTMMSTVLNPSFSSDVEGVVSSVQTFALIANGVFALAFSALYGWLIYKLISPSVRAEFYPNQQIDAQAQ
jgi:hypothetical protein